MDKFNWIENHFLTKQKKSWNHISDIVPNIFDEYYLVHWKVGIIDKFPFDDYPEQNETIEQTNKRIKIEKAFGLFLNPNKDKLFREISLKEISTAFKKNYGFKLLDQIKQTAGIEILGKPSKAALKESLIEMANRQLLNLFVADIYRHHPIDENIKEKHTKITVEAYMNIQEVFDYDYCTYLFPEDLSWCLTTTEDFPMFLCIRKGVKHKFQNHFGLETFKLGYNEELY